MQKLILLIIIIPIYSFAQMNQTGHTYLNVLTKLFGFPIFLSKEIKKIGVNKKYELYFNKTSSEATKCSQICPKDYRILKDKMIREQSYYTEYYDPETQEIKSRTTSTHNISLQNRLAFLNEEKDFENIAPRTFGYCWGYSNINRRFNILASYTKNFDLNEIEEINKLGKKKFYKRIIKNILKGKYQNIPGYIGLYDFSSDPIIQDLLKKSTVKEWKKKAVNIKGLSLYLKRKEMKDSDIFNILNELDFKLKTNQNPLIYFTHDELSKYIHVVPVYKMEKDGDSTRICFIDNHDTLEDHKNCGKNVTVRNGNISFSGWDDYNGDLKNIKRLGIVPEDKYENIQFVNQLHKACLIKNRCN